MSFLLCCVCISPFFGLQIQISLHGRSLATNSGEPTLRENLSDVGKLGLRLLEDLTALSAGGSVCANNFDRTFSIFFVNKDM